MCINKKEDVELVKDLILLVLKYAQEACQCDAMIGYSCEVHSNVREGINTLKTKYGVKLEV